jgi:ribosomal subunit interface protein
MFEKAIAALYRKMGYQVVLTSFKHDQGADIVALKLGKERKCYLIQCKHTSNPNKAQNQRGIQEVLAACGVYQQEYNVKFKPIVITNANRFTDQAMQIAEATIHVSGADLFAKAESDNLYVSIDQMVNKLDSQIKKHKEKLNDHRKN